MELANTHKLFLEDALPDNVLKMRMEWAGGSVRKCSARVNPKQQVMSKK